MPTRCGVGRTGVPIWAIIAPRFATYPGPKDRCGEVATERLRSMRYTRLWEALLPNDQIRAFSVAPNSTAIPKDAIDI